jgi:hypothetical protein
MKSNKRLRPLPLQLEELEPRLAPAAPVGTLESFDTTTPGQLPSGWVQWSNTGASTFAVSSSQALSAPNTFAVSSPTGSGMNSRSWLTSSQSANMQVQAAVYLNSPIPAEVLARGTGLETANASYYAVSVTQGLDLKLQRVQNGTTTTLGEVRSANWLANQWAYVTLYVNGNNLRAEIQRNDNGQYLNSSGQWQSAQTWALNLTDTAISGGGDVGLGRLPSYTGTVYFDDFSYGTLTADSQPPTVTINAPPGGSTVSGVTQLQASVTDNVGVSRVEYYVDNVLRAVAAAAPYTWNFDSTTVANGSHTLTVKAYDPAQNIGQASVTITTQNDFSPLPRPSIPQHSSNIRLADIAYNGGSTQLPPSDIPLLQNAVDLVIADTTYLSQIYAAAPDVPQLIYTNVSSIYQGLLTDWLNYADAHSYSREEAFYHVAQATPFSGAGGSTQPVNWFWGVFVGGSTLTDRSWQAHDTGFAFGGLGQSVYLGYPDRFREINLKLASGASGGWSGVLEYATAVDASGNPTAWAPLQTISDTTVGLTQSGQITFDPPADWKAASVGGSAPLFYVRIRTLTAGTAPVVQSVLGRDYVGANGTSKGVIPAFDLSADTNHDGYLSDAEYAHRTPGMDARFLYESRLFSYGQMRFATNPGDAAFRSWAIDYDTRYLNSHPLAAGLFMDNSTGKAPASVGSVLEPVGSYSTDYASLVYEIGRAIAPKWLLANTAGGGSDANPTIQRVQGYFEEFTIRALAVNYQLFESMAAQVAGRAALASPAPYAVLDSHPQGGSATDPRTELATLAYYYLLADPNSTFLDYDGGYDTTGPWSRHWFPAMGADIGQPAGAWSLFATGADPANAALTYRIYQRSYSNALVLYKPLSYGNGVTGTLADATATTHELGGLYYPLQADGTLGAPVTSITLRNGEGAILVKASSVAASLQFGGIPSSTTAGAPLSFTVSAVDASGHIVPGHTGTVHFASTDGAAVLPGDYTFTAADNGVHTFTVAFHTAGTQALIITDTATGITGTQGGITVNPAAASRFVLTAPAAVNALTPFRLTVTVVDAYGNQVPSYTGTIHFTSSDSLAWLPPDYTFTAADGGQHTFTSGLILWQMGNQTISATDLQTGITGTTMIQVNRRGSLYGMNWIPGY